MLGAARQARPASAMPGSVFAASAMNITGRGIDLSMGQQ